MRILNYYIALAFWVGVLFSSPFSYGFEDARVLPEGRNRFSVMYARTGNLSQEFNADGSTKNIADPYNMSLDAATLSAIPEFGQLVNVLNSTGKRYDINARDNGSFGVVQSNDPSLPLLGDALSRGFLNVGGLAYRSQYNLIFQHGFTDRISAGFMIPYIQYNVHVNHSITGANTASDIYNGFALQNPSSLGSLINGLSTLANANDAYFQGLLAKAGYAPFGDFIGSGLGDIVLGGRYKYLDRKTKSGDWIASFQAGSTVPTGAMIPPSQITEPNFGQGVWDVGIANIVNYTPRRWVTFSAGQHYTLPFWGQRLKRIRKNPADFLPDASDEELSNYRPGDKYWLSAGAEFHASRAVDIDTGVEWDWQGKDTYTGHFTDRDYTYLSDGTDTYLEMIHLGASISSIPAFFKHDFPAPGQILINAYIPLDGRNSIIAAYATAELALYF